jgi:polyisoprenoid-binding protein YceI
MAKKRALRRYLPIAWLLLLAAVRTAGQPLVVDASRSHVTIDVGKAGVLGFAGHIHEVAASAVRGTVTLDPADWRQSSVALEFDAAALRVTGKGESPSDVPQVQQVMLSNRVLDAGRFPVVTFRSRKISMLGGAVGAADLQIDGDVTLHGVTRPVSVRARATLNGPDVLTTRGVFSLKQSDFGIEPVTAAGGSIRVKDAVDVQFELVAHR